MPFKVQDAAWLDYNVTLCKGVLKAHLEKDTYYTTQQLLDILEDHGYTYSIPDFQLIRVELFKLGVLEGEE